MNPVILDIYLGKRTGGDARRLHLAIGNHFS
jgi:hypothetical protein